MLRSGKRYQEWQTDMEEARGTQRQGGGKVIGQANGRDGLADLLHMLMEDCKLQDERLVEEKWRQEEERRLYKEDRKRQYERLAKEERRLNEERMATRGGAEVLQGKDY